MEYSILARKKYTKRIGIKLLLFLLFITISALNRQLNFCSNIFPGEVCGPSTGNFDLLHALLLLQVGKLL